LIRRSLSFSVSGLLSEQTLRRIRLQREVPRRLFAGAPASFALRLTNGKRRLPSYALLVTEPDPSGAPPPSHFVLKVSPQACACWMYSSHPQKAGGAGYSALHRSRSFVHQAADHSDDYVLVYPAVISKPDVMPGTRPGWRSAHAADVAPTSNLRPIGGRRSPLLLEDIGEMGI
jgi:hypothetical protein